MLNRRSFLSAATTAPFFASTAAAGSPCVFEYDGVAMNGMDPVGYFTQAQPVAGQDRFRIHWRHAIWRFSTAETMAAFERDPRRFAPRYGGFCAVNMAKGRVADTHPDAWAIHDGCLYLAESLYAIGAWQNDPAHYVASADAHWVRTMCN